jgi:hypothetical protein
VNINSGYHSALELDLAQALAELLGSVHWLQGWDVQPEAGSAEWDLLAKGPLPRGGKAALCIECKSINFQPGQFSTLVERQCVVGGNVEGTKVLAMPRVSSRMAALCEAHGWGWYDLAGNCRLEIPGALLLERSGKKLDLALPRSSANLGSPEAARIIRALLAPENAGLRWTQRDVVAHFAGLAPPIPPPSLALVNKVIQHLRDQAFIEQLPNRGFRVRDYEALLQAWRVAYRFDHHARRRYFTLLQGRSLQEKLLQLNTAGNVAYAAFTAADFQAPTVRQPRTWLYVDRNVEPELQAVLEGKLVDSGENLIVLIAGDPGVFYKREAGPNRIPCTNAVQTYIDLLHSGGRGEEAAQAILSQRLQPAWSAAAK